MVSTFIKWKKEGRIDQKCFVVRVGFELHFDGFAGLGSSITFSRPEEGAEYESYFDIHTTCLEEDDTEPQFCFA